MSVVDELSALVELLDSVMIEATMGSGYSQRSQQGRTPVRDPTRLPRHLAENIGAIIVKMKAALTQQPAADAEAAEQFRKGWVAGHAAQQPPADSA